MVYTYITDKAEENSKYVSYIIKQNTQEIYKAIEKSGNGHVILDKSMTSTLDRPSFYILEETQGVYTIVVRGTVNKWDKGTDLDITQNLIECNGEKFYVHQGFYRMALAIYGTMEEQGFLNEEKKYIACGHSLGGAIACILGFLLFTQITQQTTCYTFGMPPTGSYNFAVFCKNFCWSMVNNCDIVCGMSIHGFNVQQQRLIYMNNMKMRFYDKKYLISACYENYQLDKDQHDNSDETFYPTSVISKLMTTEQSNFVCGKIIHFIHDTFYLVDPHDLGEFSANMHNAFDHFTYQWLGDYIEELIKQQ